MIKVLKTLVIYIAIFALLYFSTDIKLGITNGINIVIELLIPSLFAFMILSNIIINSKLKFIISKPFSVLAKILRLENKDFTIFMLSLIGGYPIAPKMIASEVKNGSMTIKTANRMLCFCVNCSPAFLISGIGATILNSSFLGLIIYLSQLIAAIIIALITSIGVKVNSTIGYKNNICTPSEIFVTSVIDASKTIVIISSFVVAFSSIMPLIIRITGRYGIILTGLLEVTVGCANIHMSDSRLILATIFTAFGSVSIILQIIAILQGSHISIKQFLFYRILYVIISTVLVVSFTEISNIAVDCNKVYNSSNIIPFSISPYISILLLLLSILLLFFSKKDGKIKARY